MTNGRFWLHAWKMTSVGLDAYDLRESAIWRRYIEGQ